jgi:phosphoesterase RecJ-like protein
MLALAEALEALGKEVRTVNASTYPPRYAFLDPGRRVRLFEAPGEEYRDSEAVVVLDTGTWNQLGSFGPFLKGLPVARAVIDHHLTQDDLDALRLVDTTAEATGRLAREVIGALGVPLSPGMGSNLFVAVAMDTGWFRHGNTSPATFALAAELVAAGARPELLYDELYEHNSPARLRLTGLLLERLTVVHGGRVAYTELRRGDYEATGATPQDSEDLVNYTRSVQGVEVGLLFMEQPRGGVKVSFRSRGAVDVARLAETFGGGGHRQASGAVLPDCSLPEARARVLQAVADVLAPAS